MRAIIYARNLLFRLLAGTAPAKLCIKSLISHDIAARQWRRSHPSPYFAREIKIHQKMSTKKKSARCSRTHRPGRRLAVDRPCGRSVFSDEKKHSIAALSQTFPDRLIEQPIPWLAIKVRNCSLVYWLPWTKRCVWVKLRIALPAGATHSISAAFVMHLLVL
jgi:hypothetical protein